MIQSEKQLSTKATTDSFDEIYTNFDLSVKDVYRADTGYPFDYPTRWLNDPSMNKRIAIRRLDVTPTTHSFTIHISARVNESDMTSYSASKLIEITQYDNLIKVLNYMCREFSYTNDTTGGSGGLRYEYNTQTNKLSLWFVDSMNNNCEFNITDDNDTFLLYSNNLAGFLMFLNQPDSDNMFDYLKEVGTEKVFNEVWNRDELYVHASFSTSRRHFIGKCGDFYQNLTLLYPPPTNESTFFIRFTTNGIKNILLRHCSFNIQLCYIVNYRKATIL